MVGQELRLWDWAAADDRIGEPAPTVRVRRGAGARAVDVVARDGGRVAR
jgi:hypothetical protein